MNSSNAFYVDVFSFSLGESCIRHVGYDMETLIIYLSIKTKLLLTIILDSLSIFIIKLFLNFFNIYFRSI